MSLPYASAEASAPDETVRMLSRGVLRGLSHVAPRQHRTPEAHWVPWRKILDAKPLPASRRQPPLEGILGGGGGITQGRKMAFNQERARTMCGRIASPPTNLRRAGGPLPASRQIRS